MNIVDDIVIKEEFLDYFEEPDNEQKNLQVDVKTEYLEFNKDIGKLENYEICYLNEYLVTPENLHNCKFCIMSFFNGYDLLEHNLSHLRVELKEEELFQCDECKVYFIDKKRLVKHFRLKHSSGNTGRKKCYLCNRWYSYKYFFSHVSDVHGKGNYKCNECFLTFKCYNYMKRHIAKRHMSTKTKDVIIDKQSDRWKCTEQNCQKVFFSKSCLAVHIKCVHIEETYECDLCPSTFKCKTYLYTHKNRVHYNDGKNHPCSICGKSFRSPRYMNIHIKNTHLKKTGKKRKTTVKVEPLSD